MKEFLGKNKTSIAIILGAIIIGVFIYLSSKPTLNTPTDTNIGLPTPEKILPSSECISFKEAENYVGDYKCVTGKIDNVFISSKGNNFLNFCPDYRTCSFSATIFSSDAYKFSNIKSYSGKTVEITGLVKTYQGRAEIIINNPSQIKIK